MSDPVRVALVSEGPTDRMVIEAAIESILGVAPFILKQLQPEESLPFSQVRGGWPGVYHWCRQAVGRAGALRHDPLFVTFDILILHLDADVAEKRYADAGIKDPPAEDLPCSEPCPPPDRTTDRLRAVILRWVGEVCVPPKTALCTPSKSTEAWVLSALYPADSVVRSGNLECYATPEMRLQGKPMNGRLVASGRKIPPVYRERAPEIRAAWPRVRACCTEAQRFSTDIETLSGLLQP